MLAYRVCVTGGAGLVASLLIKKLLSKGHIVHTTLRCLDDESKVGLLRRLPGAEERLVLFQADLKNPNQFEAAISGCDFVFHVATAFLHPGLKYEDVVEGVVGSVRSIARYCIESGTVKRLIYTGSVVSASPMKEDGNGYKDSIDESCWTPIKPSVHFDSEMMQAYTDSKTLGVQELLRFGTDQRDGASKGIEVVSLECGLVGGDTILSYLASSLPSMISPITKDELQFNFLLYLEELLGKIPIVHNDDVCDAHIFSMEQPSMNGRFLCASSYVSSADIARYYAQAYPQFHVEQKYLDGPKRDIRWGSTKLTEKGFKYKHDTMETILDDTVACAKRLGLIN